MQLENMTSRHYQYLQTQFGMDTDTFHAVCKEDGKALEELITELVWRECDAAEEYEKTGRYSDSGKCAIELVDILCGPYDPEEINGEYERIDNREENMNQAETVMNILSEAQLHFIESELGYTADAIRAMSDDAIDALYNQVCDIEIEETIISGGEGAYSDRERLAGDIVTLIGNALYRPEEA